jgi:DNA-binding NarL/FixJ family response regulator
MKRMQPGTPQTTVKFQRENMQFSNVVLLQSDPVLARSLIASLCHSFRSVHMASSLDELRSSVAKHRSDVAIIDMESASIPDVHSLSSEFPGVSIVCTHRLANEEMWTDALNAGAADICPSNDTRGILTAAVRSAGMMHSAAA